MGLVPSMNENTKMRMINPQLLNKLVINNDYCRRKQFKYWLTAEKTIPAHSKKQIITQKPQFSQERN